MSFGATATDPAGIVILTTDVFPLAVDMTAQLSTGQAPTDPRTTLYDQTSGLDVTLIDPPAVSGNQVIQTIRGSALTPQHIYRLTVVYTPSGTSISLTTVTQVQCPA